MSLFYVEEAAVREIAHAMKITEGAVKYHATRDARR